MLSNWLLTIPRMVWMEDGPWPAYICHWNATTISSQIGMANMHYFSLRPWKLNKECILYQSDTIKGELPKSIILSRPVSCTTVGLVPYLVFQTLCNTALAFFFYKGFSVSHTPGVNIFTSDVLSEYIYYISQFIFSISSDIGTFQRIV